VNRQRKNLLFITANDLRAAARSFESGSEEGRVHGSSIAVEWKVRSLQSAVRGQKPDPSTGSG
jgi:hypothetical protein